MRVEGWLWVERVGYADIPHTVDTALSVSQITGGKVKSIIFAINSLLCRLTFKCVCSRARRQECFCKRYLKESENKRLLLFIPLVVVVVVVHLY